MRGCRLFGVIALVLVAAGAQAQVTDVVNLDFSKTADQGKFQLNGAARFTQGRLRLTNAYNQAASAFLAAAMELS